jgi:hypothetical protein
LWGDAVGVVPRDFGPRITRDTYDADGNALTETHHFGYTSSSPAPIVPTQKWYDGEDRLVEVEEPYDPRTFNDYNHTPMEFLIRDNLIRNKIGKIPAVQPEYAVSLIAFGQSAWICGKQRSVKVILPFLIRLRLGWTPSVKEILGLLQ